MEKPTEVTESSTSTGGLGNMTQKKTIKTCWAWVILVFIEFAIILGLIMS